MSAQGIRRVRDLLEDVKHRVDGSLASHLQVLRRLGTESEGGKWPGPAMPERALVSTMISNNDVLIATPMG